MKDKYEISSLPKIESDTEDIWNILSTVYDPEIPVLSITDLGIVRNVTMQRDDKNQPIVIVNHYTHLFRAARPWT
jgi:metal-sulfur cluster biosynthetic enzyme